MVRPHSRWLAGIVLLGLGLRLIPLLINWSHPNVFMDADSWDYHRIAMNVLAGNGYSQDQQPPYEADVYRPAGLPYLLAAVYSCGGCSIPLAILFQVAVSSGLVVLTYRLARGLGAGPQQGLAAALFVAVDPLSVIQSNMLMTEVYSSLVILGTGCLVVEYFRTLNRAWLLAAGGLIGVGILIHPLLLFVPFFLMAVPLFDSRTRSRGHFINAVLVGLVALAPAAAWVARNSAVADYRGISCVAAINLLKYKAAGVEADLRGTTREIERDRLTAECAAVLPEGATRGAKYRLWQEKGMSVLLAHPFVYAKLHARGMAVQLIGPGRDNLTRLVYGRRILDAKGRVTEAGFEAGRQREPSPARAALLRLALCLQLITGLLVLVGTIRLLVKREWWPLAVVLLPAAYVLALSGGPESEPRFRGIYMPFLCMLAAAGIPALSRLARALGRLVRKRRATAEPVVAAG
jgi:4-amino-4-deoxy-L-arabinose transferase-like glycosyltransferase